MIRIIHILKELVRNLYRNPGTTFGVILSTSLLFLMFDLFWIAAGTSDKFYQDLLSDLRMEAFVTEEATDTVLVNIRQFLTSMEGINGVEYISKEKAREQLSMLVGVDLLVGYDTTNPLPRSFIISFTTDYLNTDDLSAMEKLITSLDGISYVYYSKNWLVKVERTKSIILKIGMMLGILILITVLFSSANNMRLTARARAVGFQQMRLLGAGKLFLALPFLIEGFIIGGISAGLGWLVIFYWRGRIEFTKIVIVFPTLEEIFIFCGLTALLGAISGYFGIRKMLKL